MIPTVEHLAAAGVKDPAKWIDAIVATCDEFAINTKERVAAFIAQCAHESGGFSVLEENLNYRAATMAVCWPKRFAEAGPDGKPKKDDKGKNIPNKFAIALEKHPEQIANVVYSARMGNGPIESGEGWKYRGRGLKQLTGKDNYTRCDKTLRLGLVENPDALLQPLPAARSAGWFWHANGCSEFADKGDMEGLTKRINGGLIGIDDRKKRYAAVLKVMG